MSNKNEIKVLDNEINNLRNQVFYLNSILDKTTSWLENELEHNEPILSGDEELSDETFDIHVGRNECAKGLLEQIEKWESGDE